MSVYCSKCYQQLSGSEPECTHCKANKEISQIKEMLHRLCEHMGIPGVKR